MKVKIYKDNNKRAIKVISEDSGHMIADAHDWISEQNSGAVYVIVVFENGSIVHSEQATTSF